MRADCLFVRVLVCVGGWRGVGVGRGGGRGKPARHQGHVIEPERAKDTACSLNCVECSGAAVCGGWWDMMLFLTEDTEAKIKT